MQGKGIIRFFLILLTAVCLLQYLYLLPTRKVERDAEDFAAKATAGLTDENAIITAHKIARAEYLDSMSSEPVISIPLLGKFSYEKLKRQQIALGLDLKGGISTVLQVNLREFLETLSNNTKEPAFKQALDNADKALKNAQADYITLFGQEWAKVSNGQKIAPIFTRNATLRQEITFETSDADVLSILRKKANETVDLTFKRLKDRIDKLGVVQPNVSLDKARDLILVELPGVDNPERARNYLQSTAKLEFWDVYRVSDPGIMEAFANADDRLKKLEAGDTTTSTVDTALTRIDTVWVPKMDSTGTVIDSELTTKVVPITKDPSANTGPLLSLLKLNFYDGKSIQYPFAVMGVANKNKIKPINDMLAREQVKSVFPQDVKLMWSAKPTTDKDGKTTDEYELYAIKMKRGSEVAPLEGDRVVTATSNPDPMTNQVAVTLRMDNLGAKSWADMTTKAAQDNNREIAIALDGEVVSAPRVNEAITTGDSRISGNFSIQEGQDLANILQIGKLPASTTIVQESLIGPSLGKDNINKSMIALIVATLLVLLFMVFYYGGGGIVAIIALVANIFFLFGALSSLGTVLTLPGIAGIVLTIGMAVDANVIIYERIKEEIRAGKTLKTSIADGFRHSYAAIIDANVTTILSSIALIYFGLGPIKGFAVVLFIGILTSMFTAILVSRMIFDWWIAKGRSITFWIPPTKDFLAHLKIDWLSKRKYAYFASITFVVIGTISIFVRGFDLGVDFKGGYSYNVAFDQSEKINDDALRAALTTSFGSAPTVKSIDAVNTFNITTSYLIDDNSTEAHNQVSAKLFEGVNTLVGGKLDMALFMQTDSKGTHITSSAKVGPTIADDITKSSIYASIFAVFLIFVYILIRFTKWQYSLGVVVSAVHDALFVLVSFSLFRGLLPFSMELDQTFIAALLTIIGYSINDTIVTFDRIRENFNLYTGKTKHEILNISINQTMSRTLITVLTVFLVSLALLFFGGASIKGFAFALVIGLLTGTYSSIFVATPLLADLSGDIKPKSSAMHSFKRTTKVK
ncbi:MAG: protein translocase subunit SecDF [Saprospiraceae bacterium]|uniref:Multifunctional fusion protein n=1 Tax=Candidatus Opimibacter skivensis TaxID=2982028 RepID=A0A9D7SQP3_9BACT|nr:protein translocase subunit SecDF [Candidatus Opimibacter skivensis]